MREQALGQFVDIFRTAQFLRFLIVSGGALLVHWAARMVLDIWIDYGAAVVVAYGVGILVGYTLNRIYVFPKSGRAARTELLLFLAVNLVSFPPVLFLSWLLGRVLLPHVLPATFAEAAGHGIAITSPVFFNFAAHKYVTFQQKSKAETNA
jgi:putative flippase GtrA